MQVFGSSVTWALYLMSLGPTGANSGTSYTWSSGPDTEELCPAQLEGIFPGSVCTTSPGVSSYLKGVL